MTLKKLFVAEGRDKNAIFLPFLLPLNYMTFATQIFVLNFCHNLNISDVTTCDEWML